MAELPSGPSSALSASPSEIIPSTGGGCTVFRQGDDRDFRREDTLIPVAGLQHRASGAKGKTTQNHVLSHSPGSLLSIMPQQQQLNGILCSAEDGPPLPSISHLHHPGHRQPDDLRGPGDHCDDSGEAEECAGLDNYRSDKDPSECLREHNQRSKNNSSHSNNNCVNSVLTSCRTEANCGRLLNEVDGTDHDTRTKPEPSPGDPPDSDSLGMHLSGGTSGTSHVPVVEMARLHLTSLPDRGEADNDAIQYARYESELQMPGIMRLITKDLSEPYSIYTYRYFIHNWPQLCFLAMVQQECVGAIVCKLDMHKKMFRRGYIAMLAVDSKYRRKSIGTNLVKKAIYAMVEGDCDEVVLETEITNKPALKLYENLGFVRDKRLFRYYLNGVDALRLKLWLR
ncbi:hypothetical protein GJAV_G00108650 [Gymnothorax javanicus]|nr:hypothetical protein GJAV_G00108650 [Gymnothorax javanicus]